MTNQKLPNVNRIHFPSLLSVSFYFSLIATDFAPLWLNRGRNSNFISSKALIFSFPFPFLLIDVETRRYLFFFSDQTCFIFGLGRLLSPRANHSFRFFSLFSWRVSGFSSFVSDNEKRSGTNSIVASEVVCREAPSFFRLASFDYWLIRDLCWLDLNRSFKKGKIFSLLLLIFPLITSC